MKKNVIRLLRKGDMKMDIEEEFDEDADICEVDKDDWW